MRSWERQTSEPKIWYRRFERYVDLGENRTLLDTYNLEQVERGLSGDASAVPRQWTRIFERWSWESRADERDVHQQEKAERGRAWQEERTRNIEARRKTAQALTALMAKVVKAALSDETTMTPAELRELAQGSEIIIKLSRLEYGDFDDDKD